MATKPATRQKRSMLSAVMAPAGEPPPSHHAGTTSGAAGHGGPGGGTAADASLGTAGDTDARLPPSNGDGDASQPYQHIGRPTTSLRDRLRALEILKDR